MPITAYIPGIRQCHKCGQLSHSTKFCQNNAKCLTCGLDCHNDDSNCSNIMNCINCGENHPSLSRDCPEIILKKKTTELMVTQNMDYNSAKRIILQCLPISTSRTKNGNVQPPPHINSSEFSILSKYNNGARSSSLQSSAPGHVGAKGLASFSETMKANPYDNQKPSVITGVPSNDFVKLEKILSIFLSDSFLKILDKIKDYENSMDNPAESSRTS